MISTPYCAYFTGARHAEWANDGAWADGSGRVTCVNSSSSIDGNAGGTIGYAAQR